MENGNWPTVAGSSPGCSPCVKWPNDYYSAVWSYNISKYGFYHTQAAAAIKEWNGQPYASPMFSEGSPGCSSGSICVTTKSLPSGYCGQAHLSYPDGKTVTYGWVWLGLGIHYVDGSVATYQEQYPDTFFCDVRATYHHEVGHAFTEGHSSKNYDLMYSANNKWEKVDNDARHLLSAVYGPVNTGQGCPCLNVTALKQKALQEANSLMSVVTEQEDTL